MTVSDEVRDALSEADISGTRLTLPDWLSAEDFPAAAAVLRDLGGRWSQRENAHVFEVAPTESVRRVIETGEAPDHEENVGIPPELAQRIVDELATPVERAARTVLEPSAGSGNLVRLLLGKHPEADVCAVEPDPQGVVAMADLTGPRLINSRFEDFLHRTDRPERFDLVVQNPPWTVPGRPNIWSDHIRYAWELVAPGGRLVSIAPRRVLFREDSECREVRELVRRHGAFARTDESRQAVVLWLDKPGQAD